LIDLPGSTSLRGKKGELIKISGLALFSFIFSLLAYFISYALINSTLQTTDIETPSLKKKGSMPF
jgi:hypothetical protein